MNTNFHLLNGPSSLLKNINSTITNYLINAIIKTIQKLLKHSSQHPISTLATSCLLSQTSLFMKVEHTKQKHARKPDWLA